MAFQRSLTLLDEYVKTNLMESKLHDYYKAQNLLTYLAAGADISKGLKFQDEMHAKYQDALFTFLKSLELDISIGCAYSVENVESEEVRRCDVHIEIPALTFAKVFPKKRVANPAPAVVQAVAPPVAQVPAALYDPVAALNAHHAYYMQRFFSNKPPVGAPVQMHASAVAAPAGMKKSTF